VESMADNAFGIHDTRPLKRFGTKLELRHVHDHLSGLPSHKGACPEGQGRKAPAA